MVQSLEARVRKLQDLYWSSADPDGRGFVPLADALRRAGELLEARRILREGMERHPDFVSGHVVSAWLSLDQGRPEEAAASFEAARELDPQNLAALRGMAEILLEKGEVGAALGYLRDLAQQDPLDPELPVRMAELEEGLVGSVDRDSSSREPGSEDLAPPMWVDLDEVAEELDWTRAVLQEDLTSADVEVPVREAATEAETSLREAREGGLPGTEEELFKTQEELPESEEELPGLAREVLVGAADAISPEVSGTESPTVSVEELHGEVEPWVAEDGVPVPDPREAGDTLVTSTLGKIYLRQGCLEWAEEVFRAVLDRHPEDTDVQARLEEVRVLRRGQESAVSAAGEPLSADESIEISRSPAEGLAPEPKVSGEALTPEEGIPVESLAPETVVPIDSLAPETIGEIEALTPEEGIPVESLAPETVVLIESLAPETVVPIDSLAPETIVEIDALAPEGEVPVDSLAPETIVPIGSLAPDAPPDNHSRDRDRAKEEKAGDTGAIDAFQRWLDSL